MNSPCPTLPGFPGEASAAFRPVILILDDEPAALASMTEALGRRYGQDYQILPRASAQVALADLEHLKADTDPVALLLADQWMPEMTGVEFLQKAHDIHPAAQRALLVTWGDRTVTSTILQACALNLIENYILKPWSPPEVHLYPLVGEFLSDWARVQGPRRELVKLVCEDASPRAYEVSQFLERNGIPHVVYQAAAPAGQRLLKQTGLDRSQLPAVIMLDGRVLVDPSNSQLADELGITDLNQLRCDLAIVGAGPAGLAAAVYGASEGLRTLVIERDVVGGQAGSSSLIRNYLGFPRGISGLDLTQRAYQQAWLFGAKYALAREVSGLRAEGTDRIITLSDGNEVTARAALIATGADYRRLDLPDIERFAGAGLFYAAGNTSLIALIMQGKVVIVAGGGNAAGQAVTHLSKHARRVILLVRGESLEAGMSDYLVRHILRLSNVEVRLRSEVAGGDGRHRLERVVVRNLATGAEETLEAAALFVMIGARPHTAWLAATIARDENDFVLTGSDLTAWETLPKLTRPPLRLETSMPGVFAAGDVRAGSVKRLASAVGEGAVAVEIVHEYLKAPVQID